MVRRRSPNTKASENPHVDLLETTHLMPDVNQQVDDQFSALSLLPPLGSSPTSVFTFSTFGWENINPVFPVEDEAQPPVATEVKYDNDEKHTSCTKRVSKNVTFSDVYIREFDLIVGDHPCSTSLPLSLGWQYCPTIQIPIDTYERMRGPRRRGGNLVLSYFMKRNRLRRISGMNERDIRKAERRIRRGSLDATANSKIVLATSNSCSSIASLGCIS